MKVDAITVSIDYSDYLEQIVSNRDKFFRWLIVTHQSDKKTIDILNEKGCKLALTIEDGVARVSQKSRFLLPRIDTINIPINTNIKIL